MQEAAGEPYEGKLAVAEVILRRTKRKYMSDGTVASTVLWPRQFSGWNTEGGKWRVECAKADSDDPVVQECTKAWVEVVQGRTIVPDCMWYYNPTLAQPSWARGATVVAEIGKHRFVVVKG